MFLQKLTPSILFTSAKGNGIRHLSFINRNVIPILKETVQKPKQHANGYCLFYVEKFRQINKPGLKVQEAAALVGSEWKALSEVEKKVYLDRALVMAQERKANLMNYMEKKTPAQALTEEALRFHQQYFRGLIQRREIPKEIISFVKNMPAAPVKSGRVLFIREMLSGKKDAIQLMHSVNEQWKSLSDSEKKSYNERASKEWEAWKGTLTAYLEEQH